MANGAQTPERPGPPGSRLDSWKEIAAYLNRHVTTVRRWEKSEGLPVHRHVHEKLGSVYAYRGEIDAWWDSRRTQLEQTLDAADASSEGVGKPEPGASLVDARDDPSTARVPRSSLRGVTLRWQTLVVTTALAVALGAYLVSRAGETTGPGVRSLAVLPLQNLSGDPSQEYLADGLTEALIANLAQVRALRVTSRTSVMRFRRSDRPLPEIARDLGVDAVIEGSVQRSGDRVHITMQLIDGKSDRNLWAGEYERALADVLALQAEVARAVTDQIRVHVTAEERQRLSSARRIDPAAHEAYLLGRYHAWKLNDDDLKLAIAHFERAIASEPRFAAAYADLSLAWQYRSVFGITPYDETEAPARAAAERGHALDQELAAVHMASGHFRFAYGLEWAGAEADLRRALELDPNSVDGHYYAAKVFQSLGRFPEAVHHMERARQLDPLSSQVASFFAKTLYNAGRYEEAIQHLTRAIELEPRNVLAHIRLAEVNEAMGRHDDALTSFERDYGRTGDRRYLPWIARVQARMGRREQARRTLDEAKVADMPLSVAAAHAALGDNDAAFRLLEEAFDGRERARLLFVKVDPLFASLRSDPRWPDLLQRLNLQ